MQSNVVVKVLRPRSLTTLPITDTKTWRLVCKFLEPNLLREIDRKAAGQPEDERPTPAASFELTLMKGKAPTSIEEAMRRAQDLTSVETEAGAGDRSEYGRRVDQAAIRREQQQRDNRAPGGSYDKSKR